MVSRNYLLDGMGWEHTVFPFGLHLDQHFVLSHYFNNLADIATRFMQELQFLTEKSYYDE